MKNNKREIVFMVLGVLFLIVVLVSMGVFKNLGQKVAEDFYVNAQGEKWTLPTEGTYEFTASSGSYPKFLSGKVDPLKVAVGDTQTMRVKVASPTPLKGVTAFIETDTKTMEVPLALVENKALSGDYFESQPYLINDKNELIINSAGSSYASDALKTLVASAEAQAVAEYTFEGSWVVNDTHTKTYHTKFVAEAENGDKNQMTLAWSDPVCVFNRSGELQGGGCAPTTGVEGFDGGSITIPEGTTLTLSGTATFVWNGKEDPGETRSVTVSNDATISIQNPSTAKISEGTLWFDADLDNDTWPSNTEFIYVVPGGTCEGCQNPIRVKLSPARPWENPPQAGIDCIDDTAVTPEAADVHPQPAGQEKYFKNAITNPLSPSQAYDYNCSGGATGGWGSNVPADITSTTLVYQTVSGGEEDGGGGYFCTVGQTLSSSSFANSGYCNQTSGYSIISCDAGSITQTQQGSAEVIPPGLDNGFTTYVDDASPCSPCIATSLSGFCH